MQLLLALLATEIAGHSSLVSPRPRNAVDADLEPWKGAEWGPGTLPHNASCKHPAHEDVGPYGHCWACACVNGTEPCDVAQTCLYFSQGCSIGCDTCDGLESNPNTRDRCGRNYTATNNDPEFRTYDRNVPALSPEDRYRWNPWRAPGHAPVYDPCGMAGGGPKWVSTQLSFIDTKHNKQGDLGSKVLPRSPTGVVWRSGDTVEAKWSIRANHGGGYSYRLCKADRALTEECFQETPVAFAGRTYIEWSNGTRLDISGHARFLTSEFNRPANSTWAMNPLPYSDSRSRAEFEPPCAEDPSRRLTNDTGLCSGRFPWAVSIIDVLVVPKGLPAGEWVLGFRWDCEATAQVWQSCADIEISNP